MSKWRIDLFQTPTEYSEYASSVYIEAGILSDNDVKRLGEFLQSYLGGFDAMEVKCLTPYSQRETPNE